MRKSHLKIMGAYVEVDIGFMGNNKPSGQSENVSEKGESIHLILELVKEIIQKNRGTMTQQVDK